MPLDKAPIFVNEPHCKSPWVLRCQGIALVQELFGGYPVAATSAVGVFAAARRATHSSSDCWRPSVRYRRSDALEQSATRHYWLCVTDVILLKLKTFLFSIGLSFPRLHFSFSGPWGFYLGHFKNFLDYVHVCMYVCMYVMGICRPAGRYDVARSGSAWDHYRTICGSKHSPSSPFIEFLQPKGCISSTV